MNKLSLVLLSLLVLFACRKDEGVDGPNLNDLFGDFAVLQSPTVNMQSVNFPQNGPIYFDGELTKNTDWNIQFVGASSGATRVISGSDRIMSSENTEWDGGADNFPGFGLEDVYVEINFPEEVNAPVFYDTITVTGAKEDEGIFITGFENGIGSDWTVFNQTTVTGGIVCGNGQAAKGNCHYSFNGTVTWDWAIGSVMIKNDGETFDLPASASNLYFNMGFKALENVGPTNSFILFWFDEDENGDGVFDESSEDRWTYEYWSNGSEWDLISKNYAELQFDPEGNNVETNGNGLPEPAKLTSINVFFLANPNNGNSRALVDHLIFTTDGPYTP